MAGGEKGKQYKLTHAHCATEVTAARLTIAVASQEDQTLHFQWCSGARRDLLLVSPLSAINCYQFHSV